MPHSKLQQFSHNWRGTFIYHKNVNIAVYSLQQNVSESQTTLFSWRLSVSLHVCSKEPQQQGKLFGGLL